MLTFDDGAAGAMRREQLAGREGPADLLSPSGNGHHNGDGYLNGNGHSNGNGLNGHSNGNGNGPNGHTNGHAIILDQAGPANLEVLDLGTQRTIDLTLPRPTPPPDAEQRDQASRTGAMPRRWQARYRVALITSDFALAGVGALAGLITRFSEVGRVDNYLALTLCFPVIFVGFAAAGRAYDRRYLGSGAAEEFRRLFDAIVRFAATAAVLSFVFKADLARGYLLVAFLSAGALTLLGRYVARYVLQYLREDGRCRERVVIVGRERSIAELIRQVRQHPTAGFEVIGACLDGAQSAEIEGVPVLGGVDDIVSVLRREQADALAVTAWSNLSQADLRRLCWQLEGSDVQVLVAPRLTDIAGPRIHIRPVAGLPLLHVEQPVFSGWRRLIKGALERACAGLVLLVCSPALLLVGLAIRLTSRGPALFRQTRIGVTGQPFTMYKFRTMVVGADRLRDRLTEQVLDKEGLLFKVRDDPRVTTVGRWLRRFSLDELPQLINVVTGQMSLVGPRPPLPEEVSQYAPDVRRRLLVRPGLTGLWQISGRSDLPWNEAVRLDLYYVENWSIGLDLSILCRTLYAVLSGRGAY